MPGQTHKMEGKLGFFSLGYKLIRDEKGALFCIESFGLHWSEKNGLPFERSGIEHYQMLKINSEFATALANWYIWKFTTANT